MEKGLNKWRQKKELSGFMEISQILIEVLVTWANTFVKIPVAHLK